MMQSALRARVCADSGLLSAVGLGSVSDHCVHHLRCATVVVKDGDEAVCDGGAPVAAAHDKKQQDA